MDDLNVKRAAARAWLNLRDVEIDRLRLKADAQKKQAASAREVKEFREWEELRAQEAKLDEKLSRTTTWSPKWWHLLGQLDLVRGLVILQFQLLMAVNSPNTPPQLRGQVDAVPYSPARCDLAPIKTQEGRR